MPDQTPVGTVSEEMEKLAAFEAELNAEDAASTTRQAETQKPSDRPEGNEDDVKATPDSTKTETPSAADKEAIETARAEAEKEGKELDVDDKGTPKRGPDGKFIKRDKAVAAKPLDPAVTGIVSEMQKLTKEQRDAVLDGLYPNASKLQKDNARRDRSWRSLNEEKEKFAAEQTQKNQALQGAIAKFNADVQRHQASVVATRHDPAKFDELASKLETDAKLAEAEIIKAENDGDLDKARELFADARVLKADAEKARKYAEQLRKNPPPNEKQIQEKFKADQSTWIAKANTDFPEFAKKDSVVRNTAVESYNEIVKADPQLSRLPGLIYHCVRYAAAKTAADRVPAMEKELGELRTKVKDLEVLTNPAPQGGVPRAQSAAKPFEQMSDEEAFAELQREAAGIKR